MLATLSIHVSTGSDDGRLRRPLVVMVEPTEDRKPDDVSTDLRDRPRGCAGRYPLKQPLMRTGTIEVDLNVLPQYTMQLPFAEYYHVVQALPTHRSEEAFADGVQIGRAWRDLHDIDARPLGHGVESSSELVIVVSDEVRRSVTVWRGLPELLAAQASVGERITLKCTTSRVPWTTKKNAKIGRNRTS